MPAILDFHVPLRIGLVSAAPRPIRAGLSQAIAALTAPPDELITLTAPTAGDLAGLDLVIASNLCGETPLADLVAASGVPTLPLQPSGGFHPFQAAYVRRVELLGGTTLPALEPAEAAASLRALRARKALRGMKLIVADAASDPARQDQLLRFQEVCRQRLGVAIIIRSTAELRERARQPSDATVDTELARWYADILTGPGELPHAHLQQVARLYLAQRAMLAETGAVGITPSDIHGFLLLPERPVMPNVSYGPLVCDGFLACEEGDIEVLTTELLLAAGLGSHPTMSNLYYAYRDQFTLAGGLASYTPAMELADCQQCFADNQITISHFSTAGVLPPGLRVEARYTVRETLPSWPGQSMIAATPRLGPIALARLGDAADTLHLAYGDVTGLAFGEHCGWYRHRWFIRLPDARHFATRCLHHHYAIAPAPADHLTADILYRRLLKLAVV